MERKSLLDEKVELFFDLTLYTYFFNFVSSITFIIVFFKYGEITHIPSIILAAFSLFFTAACLINFWLFPGDSRRFRFSFRREKLALAHYYFHLFCIFLSVLLLNLLPEYPWCPLIPQVLMVIYTLVYRPYPKIFENLRSAYNYITMSVITSMSVYYSMTS